MIDQAIMKGIYDGQHGLPFDPPKSPFVRVLEAYTVAYYAMRGGNPVRGESLQWQKGRDRAYVNPRPNRRP